MANVVELIIRGNDQSAKAIASSVKNLQGMDSALGAIKSQLAAFASVGALTALAKSAIDMGSALNDASKKYGVAAAELAKYQYAAKMSGVEFEGLGNAFKFLSKAISESEDPTSEAAKAFGALGLSAKDLKGLSTDQVFELVADRMAEFEDGANKTALALKLFGRAGADILPVMEKGGAGIRQMKEEAVRLGAAMSETEIKKLDEYGDAIDTLGMQFKVAAGKAILFVGKLWEIRKAARAAWMQNDAAASLTQSFNFSGLDDGSDDSGVWNPKKKAAPSIAGKGKDKGKEKDPYEELRKYAQEYASDWSKWTDEKLAASAKADKEGWDLTQSVIAQEDAAWVALAESRVEADFEAAKVISDNLKAFHDNTITIYDDLGIAAAYALGDLRENLVDVAMTGKANWHDMAEAMIRDILRVAAQWAIIQPLTAGLGSAFGFKIPIPGLASGGPVSAGSPYLVGEQGPELFVPSSSGSIVPNGAGGGNVTVNVINKSGAPVAASGATARLDGTRWVVDVVLDAMNRNVGGLRTAIAGA